jgi:hypothetical protein
LPSARTTHTSRWGTDRAWCRDSIQQAQEHLREASEDYYWAVDREDWDYTYEYMDSETQSMFTEEEWYLKNQWFADAEGLVFARMDVQDNARLRLRG